MPQLLQHAPDAVYVPVTNPCDVLTVAAQRISGLPTERVFTPDYLAETAREVTQAAYKVIAGKGATNYAIGLSGARIVKALLRDENAVLPVPPC